jgi:hypothetical protein
VKRLSIEACFTWAQRFIAREWGLVLPVTLMFIGFPPLALMLLIPADLQQAMMTVPIKDMGRVQAALAWLFPAALGILAIGGVGALAITALALTPRMSVGEAIAHAVRRLPILAGSAALLALGACFFAVVELTLLALIGLDPARLQIVAGALMFVVTFALLVRMSPLLAVISDRRIGPISAISETWAMGRGAGWKMFLALLIYYVAVIIVIIALGTAIGAAILAVTRLGGWSDVAPALLAVFDRILGSIGAAGAYILGASFYLQLGKANRDV